MEVHFSPETEAALQRFAASQGKDADAMVQETIARLLERAGAKPEDNTEPATSPSLAELLTASPFAGANLDLERRKDYPRSVEL